MSNPPAEAARGAATLVNHALLDLAAYERTAPARAAMGPKDAPPFTLDAVFAVGRALQTAAAVGRYRDLLLALPGYDIAHLDGLEDLARALRFVDTELARRVRVKRELPALAAEGYALRGLLVEYLDLLSRRGRAHPRLVARLRGGSGYLDLVEDLNVLVAELRDQPEEVVGDATVVTRAEVGRASELAHAILLRLGNPVEVDLPRARLLEERRKIGGLLLRAYRQVRRAMDFLRFDQGDAAELVPSLYVTRERSSRARRAAGGATDAAGG